VGPVCGAAQRLCGYPHCGLGRGRLPSGDLLGEGNRLMTPLRHITDTNQAGLCGPAFAVQFRSGLAT